MRHETCDVMMVTCDQVRETVRLWALCEAEILLLRPQGEHGGLQTGAAVLQRCHQCCRVSGDHCAPGG